MGSPEKRFDNRESSRLCLLQWLQGFIYKYKHRSWAICAKIPPPVMKVEILVQLSGHIYSETSNCIIGFKMHFIESGTIDYSQVSNMFQFKIVFVIVLSGLTCPQSWFFKHRLHIYQINFGVLSCPILERYNSFPYRTQTFISSSLNKKQIQRIMIHYYIYSRQSKQLVQLQLFDF